jgi:amino acid adenylation domain-containing protein
VDINPEIVAEKKEIIDKMAFLLHQLLSESAVRNSDREAIVFKDRTITYAGLERETNKVAHELLALGVEKGARVGVHMNRGIDAVIAAIGILKAGAVYVPIDPMGSTGRLSYIVTKCGIKTLLTYQEMLANVEQAFPGNPSLENIIVMDGVNSSVRSLGLTRLIDWREVPVELGDSAPSVHVIDSDPAYILFTSGSTGNPKGVMISHLNSLTFINSVYEFFRFQKEDRFSNICPLHFDMSVFDIYVALKAGASIVIIPETSVMFPVRLAEIIAKNKISVWNSVPSALSLLANLANLDRYDLSSLRLVLFAGELFPLKYLRRLQEAIPGARFCNMYGQTEANSSTYYWVDQLPSDGKGVLPIGRPFPNFEVFALDEDGNLVDKPEQEGELYVRASTVALGYWGEIEKTAKSFVRNPIRPDINERVYRTGDLVRLDSDGNYVFLSRKDFMIKSRGYRIEIGEIETILCNHPEIKNAVVIPIPDELIGNRLSVIIEPSTPGKITRDDIVKYCSTQLPKYMIPEMIEFRDSLPTTSSGKVDRKRLSSS